MHPIGDPVGFFVFPGLAAKDVTHGGFAVIPEINRENLFYRLKNRLAGREDGTEWQADRLCK